MNVKLSDSWLLFILFILTILTWSINWPIMAIGIKSMPEIWYASARLLLSVAIIFLWMIARGTLIIPKKKDIPLILSLGFLQIGVYMTLIIISLKLVGASRTVILSYTTLLWTTPIAIGVFGEQLSKRKFLGILLALIGIIVYFNPFEFNWHNSKMVVGGLLSIIASICWATAILHARYGRWHTAPAKLFPWQVLAAAIPVTIAALILEPHAVVHWRPSLIESLFFSSIFATIFAWWAMIVVSRHLPNTVTSLGILAVPVLTILLSVLILHEHLTANVYIAIAIIVTGLMLVTVRRVKI